MTKKFKFNKNLIKKKLDKLKGKKSFWRPGPEEARIRLLPFMKGGEFLYNEDGHPFLERRFYYTLANYGILAPSQFGELDPVQELIDSLLATQDKDDYEIAKKLFAKSRFFIPVIERGKEAEGVKLWAFGQNVFKDLLGFLMDDDYNDYFDLEEGRDLKVSSSKGPGDRYASTTVLPSPKTTAAAKSQTQLDKWLEATPDLDEIYTKKPADEIQLLVDKWMSALSPDEEEEEETVVESSSSEEAEEATTTTKSKSQGKTKFDEMKAAYQASKAV